LISTFLFNRFSSNKFKRQSEENSSLIDRSTSMFNSEVVGHFQLGLQLDTSIVVLIGNDIRDVGYSRVRTHLESAMSFNANFMFVVLL